MRQGTGGDRDDAGTERAGTAERVFDTWVADHPAPDADALTELCSLHPPLAPSLRRLWGHYETARRLFDEVTPADDATGLVAAVRGLAVEPTHYESIRELGRGGMCVVDEVRDSRLDRRLARKTLPLRLDGSPLSVYELRRLARFVLEARIASRLRHPAVPEVYDFGLDARQRPFLVLPLVEGVEFGEIVRRVAAGDPDWPLSRALSVLLTVCAAVSHAHAAGILHRDLKPENVMVGVRGETWVLDWGLARPIGAVEATADASMLELVDASRTADGDIVGTPVYLAPEHAAGAGPLSAAADQYQIGAMLYTLLAGRRPYHDVATTSTLSSLVQRVAADPPEPLAAAAPRAPAELVAICEQAMARAPEARYASVEALAADLRAYLDGRVVAAHDTGAVATLCKWVARNRGFAFSVAAALTVLIGSLSVVIALERRWSGQLRAANADLREVNRESTDRLAALEEEFYVNLVSAVQAGRMEGQRRSELRELLDRAPVRLRGLEWSWLERELDTSVATFLGNGPYHLVVAPDQRTFVTGGDRSLRLWQLEPPELLAERTDPPFPKPLAWRPDGGAIVCATASGIAFVAIPSLDVERTVELGGFPQRACFSADGRRVLACGRWPSVDVVDLDAGVRIARWPLRDAGDHTIAISPQDDVVAVGGWNGQVQMLDARSGALRRALQVDSSYGTDVSFGANGVLRILTSHGALVRVDVATGTIVDRSMMVAGDVVVAQALDPGGRLHAHARGATLFLTDTSTGRQVWTGVGHDTRIHVSVFVPGVGGLLSLDANGEVRLWHPGIGEVHSTRRVDAVVSQLELLDDGRFAVVAGLARGVGLVDLENPDEVRWTSVPATRHNALAVSPDRTAVAVCGIGCPLRIVQLADGSSRQIPLPQAAECVAWSTRALFAGMPGARAIAELDADGAIRAIHDLPGPPNWIAARGQRVAVGTRDGWSVLLDERGPVWSRSCGAWVNRVAFSADDTELACSLLSGPVEILAVDDGRVVTRLVGHMSCPNGLASTADRWVTSSNDRSLRVWRRTDGRELMRVVPDDWWLANVVVADGGDLVVTGGEARTLHIWRLGR
ncbi:MAG: protein kinase [Planctomycetes bacterium]|nr:protein kinase [Planctomycetota bacterium]